VDVVIAGQDRDDPARVAIAEATWKAYWPTATSCGSQEMPHAWHAGSRIAGRETRPPRTAAAVPDVCRGAAPASIPIASPEDLTRAIRDANDHSRRTRRPLSRLSQGWEAGASQPPLPKVSPVPPALNSASLRARHPDATAHQGSLTCRRNTNWQLFTNLLEGSPGLCRAQIIQIKNNRESGPRQIVRAKRLFFGRESAA